MMIKIGNFLFHYRNFLFPVFYAALFIPSPIVFGSHNAALITGFALCLAGQIIRVLTIGLVYIIRGGSNRRIYAKDLVTTGMFSHCRNPLYVGNILILVGLGFVANSLGFLVVMTPLFLFAYQAIVLSEEAFLFGKFGARYREYMRDVNRWLPKVSGLFTTLSSMQFHWKRVVLKEYNATYIWTAGALALYIRNVYLGDSYGKFEELKPYFAAGFVALTIMYLGIMYVKRKKLLRAD